MISPISVNRKVVSFYKVKMVATQTNILHMYEYQIKVYVLNVLADIYKHMPFTQKCLIKAHHDIHKWMHLAKVLL